MYAHHFIEHKYIRVKFSPTAVEIKIFRQVFIPYFCRGFGSEDDLAVYSSSTRVQRNDALLRRYSLV
jgi:hypothetical protein